MFRGSLGADDLQQRHGDADYFVPPYAYDAEPASTVEASVRAVPHAVSPLTSKTCGTYMTYFFRL